MHNTNIEKSRLDDLEASTGFSAHNIKKLFREHPEEIEKLRQQSKIESITKSTHKKSVHRLREYEMNKEHTL